MRTTIIGGGIVGLATALRLCQAHAKNIQVFEKEVGVGRHQTAHNSGVIHSGIYYKPDSLKAKYCNEGRKLMYEYCQQKAIPHDMTGKLIVATDESDVRKLDSIYERGCQNGLHIRYMKSKAELQEYEPNVNGIRGLFVKDTGIVDYQTVCEAYKKDIIALGGTVTLTTEINRMEKRGSELTLYTQDKVFHTDLIINCSGLQSDIVAKFCGIDHNYMTLPFRGEYYSIVKGKQDIVKGNIYPVPDPRMPFLGVHFTKKVSGGVECGPNAVLAFSREGYRYSDINWRECWDYIKYPGFYKLAWKKKGYGLSEYAKSLSKTLFLKRLQRLLPCLTMNDIYAGGSGVRAQAIDREGNLLDDFTIIEDAHGIHVLNAPSPAATSSLSIGTHIARLALKRINK